MPTTFRHFQGIGRVGFIGPSTQLLKSIDADEVTKQAVQTFKIPEGQEPTETQLEKVEQERMQQALKPFTNPKLRNAILETKAALEQVIDEQTRDVLLRAGFDAAAKERAQNLIKSFREFIEQHKDEIEALRVLYSKPHRAGLRYSQVKDLANEIKRPPHQLDPERLWQAFETLEPEKVIGHGGSKLVDVIALVRHALEPNSQLIPIADNVEQRYAGWLAEQATAGANFTPEQRRWLDAIKDHIASSLSIETDDLDELPFKQFGGPGRAQELFGDRLPQLMDELNQRLAAERTTSNHDHHSRTARSLSVGRSDLKGPIGWEWVLLTDIARLETGHTPSREHPEYWDGDIPWIGIKDARIHHGRMIQETLQAVSELGLQNSAARLLPTGTVCLSRTASVGYALVMGKNMATSQDFVNWVCSEAILPSYLMYLFLAERESLDRFGKGTTHTTIYFPEVKI